MILEGETRMRLELVGEGFEITGEDVAISPYHLLAGSLASCIALVIVPWAERAGLDATPLNIGVAWTHGEDNRVTRIETVVAWPGLPAERGPVVERLAAACPIHATLARGIELTTRLSGG